MVERRQDELAHLPFRHRLSRCRIDDLPQEMVLGDVLHVALGEALARDARAHHLGQAVVIGTYDMHAALDFRLERRRQARRRKADARVDFSQS